MNTETMEMFMRIAEGNTFSSVAQESNISQSALSKEIAKLEAELGVQLLDRSHQKASLTASGKIFYKGLCSLSRPYHQLLREVKLNANIHKYNICIFPPMIYELNELLFSFTLKYPNNEVSIYKTEQLDTAIDMTMNHTLDFFITHLPNVDERLDYLPLREDSLIAVMSEEHPLADRESLTFEDISKYNCNIRDVIKLFLDKIHVPSSISAHFPLFKYTDSRLQHISDIRFGKYMSIFFESDLLQLQLAGLRLIPIEGFEKIPVVLAYASDFLLEDDEKKLIHYLQEQLAKPYYTLQLSS